MPRSLSATTWVPLLALLAAVTRGQDIWNGLTATGEFQLQDGSTVLSALVVVLGGAVLQIDGRGAHKQLIAGPSMHDKSMFFIDRYTCGTGLKIHNANITRATVGTKPLIDIGGSFASRACPDRAFLELQNVTFHNVHSTASPAIVYTDDISNAGPGFDLIIAGSTFRDNVGANILRLADTEGSVIHGSRITPMIRSCRFLRNKNHEGAECTSTVFFKIRHDMQSMKEMYVKDSLFLNNMNQGTNAGGALTLSFVGSPTYHEFTIFCCTFQSNYGGYRGGALRVYGHQGGTVHVRESQFLENTAADVGGAIQFDYQKLLIDVCVFHGNRAGVNKDGNAIYSSYNLNNGWGQKTAYFLQVTRSEFVDHAESGVPEESTIYSTAPSLISANVFRRTDSSRSTEVSIARGFLTVEGNTFTRGPSVAESAIIYDIDLKPKPNPESNRACQNLVKWDSKQTYGIHFARNMANENRVSCILRDNTHAGSVRGLDAGQLETCTLTRTKERATDYDAKTDEQKKQADSEINATVDIPVCPSRATGCTTLGNLVPTGVACHGCASLSAGVCYLCSPNVTVSILAKPKRFSNMNHASFEIDWSNPADWSTCLRGCTEQFEVWDDVQKIWVLSASKVFTLVALADGEYVFKARAQPGCYSSVFGSRSETVYSFNVDTVTPTAIIVPRLHSQYTNDNMVLVSFSALEPGVGMMWFLNGKEEGRRDPAVPDRDTSFYSRELNRPTSQQTYGLQTTERQRVLTCSCNIQYARDDALETLALSSEGPWTIQAWAYDLSGNVQRAWTNYTVLYDATPPVTVILEGLEDNARINFKNLSFNLVPVSIAVWLYRHRGKLREPKQLERFGFLYSAYCPGCEFWELFEIFRKTMLTAVILVFQNSPRAQAAFALLVCIFAQSFMHHCKPQTNPKLYFVMVSSYTSTSGVFLSSVVLLGSSRDERGAIGVFLVVITALQILFCLFSSFSLFADLRNASRPGQTQVHPIVPLDNHTQDSLEGPSATVKEWQP